MSLRRPAVSCLCVCPCACLSLICSLRKVECLAGFVGARGASVGRRGRAEEYRWTVPPWLPVGLGTGQMMGRMGAQGPGCAAPRPAGGSEAHGLQGVGGGAGSQTPPGRVALISDRDGGRPGSQSAAGPGEAQGGRAPRPPSPSAHPPRPRTQARPACRWGSRKPSGPLDLARPLLAMGWRCWAGGGWRCSGVWRHWPPGSGHGLFGSSTACAPVERCGRLARPAGQSEREVQHRALRVPRSSRLLLQPYHPERA